MDNFAILIPIIAVGAPFGVAIIAMLTKHQQRMAELYHQNATHVDPRLDALQRDVADLKDLVHQQTIAIDRLTALPPRNDVTERLTS